MATINMTGPVYAQGVPNMTTNFILPPSFSMRWIMRFWPTDQLPWLCRSKYYADCKYGTSVDIPREIDVSFDDFTIGMDPKDMNIQRPNPEDVHLDIDQQNYAHVALSAIDRELSPHDLAAKYQAAAAKAGKKMLNTKFHDWAATDAVQAQVAAVFNAGATASAKLKASNLGTKAAPIAINANGGGAATYGVTQLFTNIEQCFQDQDIDDVDGEKRVIIPPWLRTKMLQSELKVASLTRDPRSILRTGYIGDPIAGMHVATSTCVHGSGATANDPSLVVAASDSGFAFTVRMQNADKFPMLNHEDILRLLLVWGRGMPEPRAVVFAWVYWVADAQ